MRTLLVMVVVFASMAQAKVWTTVYRCDEKTPLVAVDPNHPTLYRDIMVGTHLVIVVSSDAVQEWWGILGSSADGHMSLTGRGYDPEGMTYADSVLPAAGEYAYVMPFNDTRVSGFSLSTDFSPAPGEWFIFDYLAEQVGFCSLEMYDFNVDWSVPIETWSFSHVPSCDFNGDRIVDFEDFALLASHSSPVPDSVLSNQDTAFDLNLDSLTDFRDLAEFAGHWLERTACDSPIVDPNQSVRF